jgi:hypothetical protein
MIPYPGPAGGSTPAIPTGAAYSIYANDPAGASLVPVGVQALNGLAENSQELEAEAAAEVAETSGQSPTSGSAVEGFSGFSPDDIFAYCETRLDSINEQAQNLYVAQQNGQTAQDAINDCANFFKGYSTSDQTNATNATGSNNIADLQASLQATIDKVTQLCGPNCSALPQLLSTQKQLNATALDGLATSDELGSYANNITGAANDINNDSELQMVTLQSLMSQRETAISLTTNLMQSIGDEDNKIADNIGK